MKNPFIYSVGFVFIIISLFSTEIEEEHIKAITSSANPSWAQNNPQKVKEYYLLHEETRFDYLMRYTVYNMGVMIHGNMNQDDLLQHISSFDIEQLLQEGPQVEQILSLDAQQLIYDSLRDIPRVVDVHIHNLGYDEGNYLNPKASVRGLASWKDYFTFLVLRYAAGMSTPLGSTQAARERIQSYCKHFPKLCGFVLPIHQAILTDGTSDWDNTGSYLKNRSALLTALTLNNSDSQLVPAISVHPFDPKWKEKLFKAFQKGIRLVKWMPPQSIQPDCDVLDSFYETMKSLGMTLIAHGGLEHAIPTTEENKKWQDWGNPLRFRKPLEKGVNVILAHCGHEDLIPDLDVEGHPPVPGYHLFLRLARETHKKNQSGEWTGKLYGDLAAITIHSSSEFIKDLLVNAHEEGIRFIYGSDYPYTNIIQPRKDAYINSGHFGLIPFEKIKPLQEIRAWNPLLANYVFTKNLEWEIEGEKMRFPDGTFSGIFPDGELLLFSQEDWKNYKNQ